MSINKNIEDILLSREKRVLYQRKLIQIYHKTLISFKLNIPGPQKDSEMYRKIFDNGLMMLKYSLKKHMIPIIFDKSIYKTTGPEAFVVVDAETRNIKTLCTEIEETDELGRIYDFDVIDSSGKSIGREAIGRNQRKCFLCDEYVWACARSRAHNIEEMLQYIEETAKTYFEKI